jgi:hypothetical protein
MRGIIWYCWYQAGGGPLGVGIHAKPKAKAFYKEMLAELNLIMPAVTSLVRRTFEEGDVHGIVLGNNHLLLVNTTDKEVASDFAVPEMKDRNVKVAKMPFAAKVERKDAQGNTVKDHKGESCHGRGSVRHRGFQDQAGLQAVRDVCRPLVIHPSGVRSLDFDVVVVPNAA